MPKSVVIYTSSEAFSALRTLARQGATGSAIKPYTFSFAQKTESGSIRVRASEISEGAVLPAIADMVKRGEATLASAADRDVRAATYEELIGEADRTRRVARLQWTSPTCVDLGGQSVPFPVMPLIFARYREVWSAFSPARLPGGAEQALDHVQVTDFKISCAAGPFGPGAKGWVTGEMEKGRTEQEIALFNGLIDFAFYCGTGLHTEEGLGQTRRMEPQQRG